MQTEWARLSFLFTDVDSGFPIYSEEQSASVAGFARGSAAHGLCRSAGMWWMASGEGRSAAASDWIANPIAKHPAAELLQPEQIAHAAPLPGR